ncbi:hypothetical protein HMPREF3193_00103 [Bifidobacterium breve]|nr:hypothetical protein HMPREF1587_00898 [Bifidobacterium breve JCP7499]KWZ86845.1 hypothetical protein HMPREF3193_00103 [Bifidobacterium breve]
MQPRLSILATLKHGHWNILLGSACARVKGREELWQSHRCYEHSSGRYDTLTGGDQIDVTI